MIKTRNETRKRKVARCSKTTLAEVLRGPKSSKKYQRQKKPGAENSNKHPHIAIRRILSERYMKTKNIKLLSTYCICWWRKEKKYLWLDFCSTFHHAGPPSHRPSRACFHKAGDWGPSCLDGYEEVYSQMWVKQKCPSSQEKRVDKY